MLLRLPALALIFLRCPLVTRVWATDAAPPRLLDNGLLRPMQAEWVHQLGSKGSERAWAVAADTKAYSRSRGSPSYVVGYTDGYLGDAANGTTASSLGDPTNADALVMKFLPSGRMVWSRRFGHAREDDYLRAVTVDHHGNVIVAGGTKGSLPGFRGKGDLDVIVVKFDQTGDVLWQKQIGSKNADDAWGIAVDKFANAYVIGSTRGRFAGQRSFGNWDVFLLKYQPDGSTGYLTQYGTSYSELARGLVVDHRGFAYVVGRTAGSLVEDVPNAGRDDAFLAKFDVRGNVVWAKQIGGVADDEFSAVAIEFSTAMIYTLRHNYPDDSRDVQAGTGTLKLFPENVTLEKWDSDGELRWARDLGVAWMVSSGSGVGVDQHTGIVYACGTSLQRGDGGEGLVDWIRGAEIFLAKYGPDGVERYTERVGSEHWDDAFGMAVGLDERVYVVGSTEGSFHGLEHGGAADMLAMQWAPMKLGTAGFPWKTFTPTRAPTLPSPTTAPTRAPQVLTSGAPEVCCRLGLVAALTIGAVVLFRNAVAV